MAKKEIVVDEGLIFCIPLFMPRDDWKLKVKLKSEDHDKQFAFGRVIENGGGSGILVEIFRLTGSISTDLQRIIESGRLLEPIYIFWIGVLKKRWKVVGETPNFDKFKDSSYAEINMVFGLADEFRLRNYGTKIETPITRKEAETFEVAMTWFPIDLEERIQKLLALQI